MKRSPVLSLAALALVGWPVRGLFAEPVPNKPAARKEPPSAEQVAKAAAVAQGLKIDVWAAEPLLANPVAFAFDNQGRAWVAETNRRKSSYLDIRSFPDWVPRSLALRSVEERTAFLKEVLPEGAATWPKSLRDLNGDGKVDWHDLEVESEIVRLVEDKAGSGKADTARVVADGFNSIATGVGAGIAVRDGKAVFICEPDVWIIGEDGSKKSIVQGLAVHIVYSGHDSHGAKFGPDGRLYFSVADCSARIESEGKVLAPPSCGAVFRCWPDGTGLELYAYGLRNPQSLVFNEVGDLFTGDNNADGGDKARWLHVVEGADYGWRFHYQFMKEPKLGVWNSEGLWKREAAKEAPSVLPPVTNLGHGPAGVAFYPGTGLPATYKGAFFMADFPGGVRSFKLRQKGATYEAELPDTVLMDNSAKEMTGKFAWNLNVPDVAFGPGGGLYLLDCVDWIPDYNKFDKGRIFRVHSPVVDAEPIVAETRRLLAEGFSQRSLPELEKLLAHADIRVRGEAQRALVGRGGEALRIFVRASGRRGLERLHAVWGLGQLARDNQDATETLRALTRIGTEAEVRAQAVKLLGENGGPTDAPRIASLLLDPAPRVRFFAAQALRRVGGAAQVELLIKALRAKQVPDAFQRHALATSLAALAKPEEIRALGADRSEAVRLAAVLALRRIADPGITGFLADKSPAVRLEAARAIYDEPVPAGLEPLAKLEAKADESAGVLQRIQAARYRQGGRSSAESVMQLALNPVEAASARVQAILLLRQWQPQDGRDAFLGRWWPVDSERDAEEVKKLVVEKTSQLLEDSVPAVVDAAVDLVAFYGLIEHKERLRALFLEEQRGAQTRALVLGAFAKLKLEGFGDLLHLALKDKSKELSAAASKLIGKLPPEEALLLSSRMLESSRVADLQSGLQTLAQLKSPQADAVLEGAMARLLQGKIPAGAVLDMLEAANKRGTPELKSQIKDFEAARNASDPLSQWRECLEGGDAKNGLTLFREKDELGCYRCHRAAGNGGDVGPSMDKIGSKRNREYLLRSIVTPNADYAEGFETVLLKLSDGSVAAGMLTKETAESVVLTTLGVPEPQVIPTGKIVGRDKLPSLMPEGLAQMLSKRELRDIVAFLASQK
jgi:quinoprotein glucose dehydrogenase